MEWERGALEAVSVWESPDGDLWAVTFQLAEIDGRTECVGVHLRSFSDDLSAPPRPLLARTLRAFRFSSELALAQRESARRVRPLGQGFQRIAERQDEAPAPGRPRVVVTPAKARAWRAELEAQAQRIEPPVGEKRGRRTKYSRDDLERIAAAYQAAHERGSRKPTKDAAAVLGLGHNQTAKLVQRCRDLGILPETQPRKAAGWTLPIQREEDA